MITQCQLKENKPLGMITNVNDAFEEGRGTRKSQGFDETRQKTTVKTNQFQRRPARESTIQKRNKL